MAKLRHGCPVFMSGKMEKEGSSGRRFPRYLRLYDTLLANSHDENEPPTWQVNILDCPVTMGPRPLEFIIQLPRRQLSYFAASPTEFNNWKEAFRKAQERVLEKYYRVGDLLGEGAFAKVKFGEDLQTNEIFAIKEIEKQNQEPRETEFTMREIEIMMKIQHPHIVETYDIFETSSHLRIVIEYMQGGELFDIIADQGHLSEQRGSQVMRDIITAVGYLHDSGVVHCDIKPENILCKTKEWPLRVKLCDFGLSNMFDHSSGTNSTMTAMIGTPGYVAPEVVKRQPYGPPVDMWACGVVLYVMLSGRMPFYGRNDVECLRRTAAGRYSFPDREWGEISENAKSLVRSLLQVDPNKRLTAKAALQHQWLLVPEDLSDTPIRNDFSGIHSNKRKFRRAVMAAILIERMRDIVGESSADRDEVVAE